MCDRGEGCAELRKSGGRSWSKYRGLFRREHFLLRSNRVPEARPGLPAILACCGAAITATGVRPLCEPPTVPIEVTAGSVERSVYWRRSRPVDDTRYEMDALDESQVGSRRVVLSPKFLVPGTKYLVRRLA